MKRMAGGISPTDYSRKTNEELLSLATSMYSLDEEARSHLTQELERRTIGPDEIQSYIDTKEGKTRRPKPNSHVFAWVWPSIDDVQTAEDASARAILISAIAVLLGILGSLLHLFGVVSSVPVDKAELVQLVTWVVFTVLWALVHRGIVNESPTWASIGLILIVLWTVFEVAGVGTEPIVSNYGWTRQHRQDTVLVLFLYVLVFAAFVGSIRGTVAYRKYTRSQDVQFHT